MPASEQREPESRKAAAAPEIKPYCFYKGQPVYSKEAARQLLRVSEKTLRRWVMLGKIRGRRIGIDRMDVVFFEKDLDAFLANER